MREQQFDRFGNRFFQQQLPDPDGACVPYNMPAAKKIEQCASNRDPGDECTNTKKHPRQHDDECTSTHTLRSRL